MSARLQKFESYATHLMHHKTFARLSRAEREQCREFIRANDHLDVNGFASLVNRWMLDQPKPKHYTDMWALVLQSNVPEVLTKRRRSHNGS
jgi:hypothetical protein